MLLQNESTEEIFVPQRILKGNCRIEVSLLESFLSSLWLQWGWLQAISISSRCQWICICVEVKILVIYVSKGNFMAT